MGIGRALRDQGIRVKLGFSFAILALAAAVVGGFGLAVTSSLSAEMGDLAWTRLPLVQGLGTAREGVTAMRALTDEGLLAALARDEAGVAEAWRARELARARAMNGMARLGELPLGPAESALWGRIDPAFQAYVLENASVWQAIRERNPDAAARLLAAGKGRLQAVIGLLEDLAALQGKAGDELMVRADETAARTRRALWTVVVLAFVTAVAMAALLARTITGPVRTLRRAAQELAAGDLTQEIRVHAQDEVGELAESFRQMVAGLRETVSTLQDASHGLGAVAGELTEGARVQNASLESQAAAVAQTSTTLRELEQTASAAASHASAVLDVAGRAAALSEAGQVAAEEGQRELQQIQAVVETLTRGSVELVEQARRASAIVETVHDLAKQSHVLSLNASIEAAGAGEAGQGFGVVAQEMRALAEQSREGARQIAALVEGIVEAAEAGRERTQRGAQGLTSSLDRLRRSGESLRDLGAVVGEASDGTLHIATAVQQQSAAIAQIATALREIDDGMGRLVERVQALEGSAQQLGATSVRIGEVAQRFRV